MARVCSTPKETLYPYPCWTSLCIGLSMMMGSGKVGAPPTCRPPPPSEICSGGYRAKEMEEAQASVRRARGARVPCAHARCLPRLLGWIRCWRDRIGRPLRPPLSLSVSEPVHTSSMVQRLSLPRSAFIPRFLFPLSARALPPSDGGKLSRARMQGR